MAASTKSRQTVAHKKNNTNNRKKTYRQTPQPKKNVRKDTGIAKEASVLIAFALSVIFFSRAEIQAKRFRVPDVQIAVRFLYSL